MKKGITQAALNENILESLPDEILVYILTLLDLESIIQLYLVSHFLQQFTSEHLFWEKKIQTLFSYLEQRDTKGFKDNPRKLFIAEYMAYKNYAKSWHIEMSSVIRVLEGDFSFIDELPNRKHRQHLYTLGLTTAHANYPEELKNDLLMTFNPLFNKIEVSENQFKKDAILICANTGNYAGLQRLINQITIKYFTPNELLEMIFCLAKHKNIAGTEFLLGYLPDSHLNEGYNRWLKGALRSDDLDTAKKLIIDHVNECDLAGHLSIAREKDQVEITKLILDKAKNRDCQILDNFILAVKNNQFELVKAYLSRISTSNYIETKNQSLVTAAIYGKLNLLKLLLASYGNDISVLSRIKALIGSALYGVKGAFRAILSDSYKKYLPLLQFLTTCTVSFAIASFLLGPTFGLLTKIIVSLLISTTGEYLRQFRNFYKATQYKNYAVKTTEDLNELTLTQLEAFDIGVKSAQGLYQQILSFGSWKACYAPKAYYAGYEAKMCADSKLINHVKKRLNINLKENSNNIDTEQNNANTSYHVVTERKKTNTTYLGLKRGFLT